MKNQFTIVIPCLNEEKCLPRLLQDLVGQTNKNFDVIIVDGHSEDDTIQKAQLFQNKLNLAIIKSKKRGVSLQRNLGAKKAKGSWILFFDADNQLPDYFMDGIKYKIARHKPDIFTTYIEPDSNNSQDKTVASVCNLGIASANTINKPVAFGAMIGVTKTSFTKVNGFDETMNYHEDTDLIRRVLGQGFSFKVFKDPKIVFSFRRFRKEGTLNMTRKYAKLQLSMLLNIEVDSEKDYPMLGGDYYKNPKNNLLDNFNALQKNLLSLTKTQRKKIRKIVDQFLADD